MSRKRGTRMMGRRGRHTLLAVALLAPLVFTAAPARAQDGLKIAIGQINNWENQAPTLGQDAGIFKSTTSRLTPSARKAPARPCSP